ncbi:MAG: glycosyltransferase family 4 protein [Victivallaceae bacterium]|nr:glycosyltransferase family 4 protein [Victivallaceae bacterium]
MKIAFIRNAYSPAGGGAEKVAAKFVENFIDRGHEITVFSEKFTAQESDKLKWCKVPRGTGLSKTSSFHRRVQSLLNQDNRRDEFDLVYTMCRTFPADIFRITEQLHYEWLPIGYSRLARFNPRHFSILNLERKTIQPANVRHIIVNSQLLKQQVIEHFAYPAEKVSLVSNGIDREVYFPAETGEKDAIKKKLHLSDRFVCIFVAANFKIKGLNEAIRAIAGLNGEMRRHVTLLVVGKGNPKPFLGLAEKLNVTENLVFAGKQSHMRDYYIASDLLLYPSHYETFGNVILEACACGVPVLTTSMVGASELIKDNKNGFLVKSAREIDRITSILEAYMKLPAAEHLKFAKRALSATRNYTWENHIADLERIFEQVRRDKQAARQTGKA